MASAGGYPETRREMLRARYTFVQVRKCKDCRETVEHWRTTRGVEMDFDPIQGDDTPALPHRSTCKVKLQKLDRRMAGQNPLAIFARQQHATAVIVVRNSGIQEWVLADACMADPADMHNTVTEAADQLRNELVRRCEVQA